MTDSEDRPQPRRGRPRDPEIRLKVLSAAAGRFAVSGYETLTMEGIVADTGVAKRTLYRWWPSKAAVVAEAVIGGFIEVPTNEMPRTGDVWADLHIWLDRVSTAMQGPYGEVLRASTAIGATDPALGSRLAETFARPAQADVASRLVEAVQDGQVSPVADLEATADLLMAIIVYVGATRSDVARIPSVIAVLRSGIAPGAGEVGSGHTGCRG